MPAPLSRQFLPIMTPTARVERYIDSHYHLEMVAENTSQLVDYQERSFRLQQEAAVSNLRAMAELSHRQDETNGLLTTLVGGMDRLNEGIDDLNATATETLDAVHMQTGVLRSGFEEIATRILEQQRVLNDIADVLRRPYETKALELLKEADRALKNGMKSSGRDQQEEFKDAARLLADVIENPIGSRNYVAWFQTGWLRWKFSGNVAEAEECFYQAARLSGQEADLYHAYSLRHLAYMQYLQEKYADAYSTVHKALALTPKDHDTLYDAARYAAKTGREAEALDLLDKCIDIQPQTTVTMLSEGDFVS